MAILFFAYLGILLVNSVMGVVNYKKLSAPIRGLTHVILITLISEMTAEYLSYKKNNNSEVYHFYVIISFWLYFLIYYNLFKSIRLKLIFFNLAILFTIFCVINSLFYEKLDNIPSINLMLNNVFLVILSLFCFKNLIDQNPFEDIRGNSFFWLNTSVLVYYTLQIFSWGIMNYLIKAHKNVMPLIIFGIFLSIIYYIALGVAILLDTKKSSLRANSHEQS